MFNFYLYKLSTLFFMFLSGYISLNAQVSKPDTIVAMRSDMPIILDGMPDEPFWQQAQIITNFTQRELNEGEPTTELTKAALLYDDHNIYIACWCYDSEPDKITAKYMKRDFHYWLDDNFEVIFDTFYDKRNGYVFVINPNGARSDVMILDEGKGFNIDWNGVWDAETVINEEGWFGEIVIPFSTLKFKDMDSHTWGINLERNIRRKREQAFWQGWSQDYDFEHVSHAGTLVGLENISNKDLIEIKPYATVGLEKVNGSDRISVKVGADANYLITPTIKLNITANTDFAQIESDRAQINMNRFSLYYPEKRDFFLEGYNFFGFNIDNARMFYSRRIGISDGIQIPILAGARVTGKTGGTSIGALSIQTANKGDIHSTNYSVLRLRQDILEKSNIGMIFTARNDKDNYNYAYGLDFNYFSSELFGDKNIAAGAKIIQSQDSKINGKKNLSYLAYLNYPNDLFSIYSSVSSIQKDFNPGIGFLRRKNYNNAHIEVNYKPRISFIPYVQRLTFELLDVALYYSEDTGDLESGYYQIKPFGFILESGDGFEIAVERLFERVDQPFQIVDGLIIDNGRYWDDFYYMEAWTYEGRRIGGRFSTGTGHKFNKGVTYVYSNFFWNLNRYMNFSMDFTKNWIDHADKLFQIEEFGSSLEVSFNPKLYTTLYAQWNNEMNMVIMNFRLHWIPVVGSDFYFVINQNFGTENKITLKNTAILSKFVWRLEI